MKACLLSSNKEVTLTPFLNRRPIKVSSGLLDAVGDVMMSILFLESWYNYVLLDIGVLVTSCLCLEVDTFTKKYF